MNWWLTAHHAGTCYCICPFTLPKITCVISISPLLPHQINFVKAAASLDLVKRERTVQWRRHFPSQGGQIGDFEVPKQGTFN